MAKIKSVAEMGANWELARLKKGPYISPKDLRVQRLKYEQGIKPYRDAIVALELGPRYPPGDPRNKERTRLLQDALHELSKARKRMEV